MNIDDWELWLAFLLFIPSLIALVGVASLLLFLIWKKLG